MPQRSQAKAVFEFAVAVLDTPADLGQVYQVAQASAWSQVRRPVVRGLGLPGGPFGDQPAIRQTAVGSAGDSLLPTL